MTQSSDSTTFTSVDQQLTQIIGLADQMQNFLGRTRSAAIPQLVYEGVFQLAGSLKRIHKQVNTLEEERRSLRALAKIGQVVNSSLELDEVLQIVMDTIIRLTGAERGFLMLRSEQGEMSMLIARNWEQETLDPSELTVSHTIIDRVAMDGQPVLTTNAQEDPRFGSQQSVVAFNLRSILCVPLVVKGAVTGMIYADNRIRSGLFTTKELDLLVGFSNQAAVAIENARLFASVRQTLAEVTELKNLMGNVFESMASGVLTADVSERVLLCNRAAEQILGRTSLDLVGNELEVSVPRLAPSLAPYLNHVITTNQPVLGLELQPTLPPRGAVDLRFSLTPLKDIQQTTQGVAIVLEDLTEKKHLEAQRRLFEKMVSPAVIDQLDPNQLLLGGQRAEITILFADIRGFTSFSEGVEPEELVSVLNNYLAAGADAVLGETGTVDKFLGDAVMAWFNAPIPQADHTLRAVRAALQMQRAVELLHQRLPAHAHLFFGVGIHCGDAILGLIGTEKRLEYTAIGDSVNTARRIQESAAPGQILISQTAREKVAAWVETREVEPIQVKGKRSPLVVYEVVGLKS